jgi:hypothetical protein
MAVVKREKQNTPRQEGGGCERVDSLNFRVFVALGGAKVLFLKERHPRRDRALQTTTHRPDGGAHTEIEVLISESNTNLSPQTSQGRINRSHHRFCAAAGHVRAEATDPQNYNAKP